MEPPAIESLGKYEDLARMTDLALLAPELSEEEVARGCETARRYGIASVTLRPADVQSAMTWLKGSGVVVVAAVGAPWGASTTAVKNFEVRDALNRGAGGIATPLSLGKLRSRGFRYIETELVQMVSECRRAGATVTLDLDLPLIEAADLRVIAAKIARRTEVQRLRVTSAWSGWKPSAEDLAFVKARLSDDVELDAGAWVKTLEDALWAHEQGATRFQTTDPAPILDAWREELKRREAAAKSTAT